MGRRRMMVVGFVVLALLIMPRVILPGLIASQLERAFQEEFSAEVVEAHVQTRVGWDLLRGFFRELTFRSEGWHLDALPVESLYVHTRDLRLDPLALLTRGEIVIEKADYFQAALSVTEEGMNQYFWEMVDPSQSLRIQFVQDQALMVGAIGFLGVDWDVRLEGRFVVRDHSQLVFRPEGLSVRNTRIPAALLEGLAEQYGVLLDFRGFPVPLRLDRVDVGVGRATIYGSEYTAGGAI